MTRAVLPRPTPGSPPVPEVPDPENFTLSNGLRVVCVARPQFPQAFARLVLRSGAAADPASRPGLAAMVGSLILEGTQELPALDFHTRIDRLGATLDSRVGHDFTEIDLGFLTESRGDSLDLLRQIVVSPAFPPMELERIRLETLDALEARLDEPANLADDLAADALFGGQHPYGRLAMGDPEGVAAVSREELVAFHAEHYRPDGASLIIAGDIDIASLRDRLERLFGDWQGTPPEIAYPELPDPRQTEIELANLEIEDSPQAEIRVAGLGMRRTDPDWIPGSVANFILGGSTITGRLGSNLREDKGWTYGVRSGFAAGLDPAGWVVETAVGAEVAADALREIASEVGKLRDELVDPSELARAKEALILSLPRAFETPARIVSRLATLEAYGLPGDYWKGVPDRIRGVTREQVREIARKYFGSEGLARVVVGPKVESA